MVYACLTKDKIIIEAYSDDHIESEEYKTIKLNEIKQIAIDRGNLESNFDLLCFTNNEWVNIINLQPQE